MDTNQTASRAAKRTISERVRNDWAWPNVPEPYLASDEELLDVTEFRERYYGTSASEEPDAAEGPSASASADPYKFDSPDSIGDDVAQKRQSHKRRKRAAQEEEMEWNEGLKMFVERRDVWTGAASVKKYGTQGIRDDEQTLTETSSKNDPTDPLIPVAPRFLPNNPIRLSIKPSAYPDIYNNIVITGRSPSVPVNLADMTRALVLGWKGNGKHWFTQFGGSSSGCIQLSLRGGGDEVEESRKRALALMGMAGEPVLPEHPKPLAIPGAGPSAAVSKPAAVEPPKKAPKGFGVKERDEVRRLDLMKSPSSGVFSSDESATGSIHHKLEDFDPRRHEPSREPAMEPARKPAMKPSMEPAMKPARRLSQIESFSDADMMRENLAGHGAEVENLLYQRRKRAEADARPEEPKFRTPSYETALQKRGGPDMAKKRSLGLLTMTHPAGADQKSFTTPPITPSNTVAAKLPLQAPVDPFINPVPGGKKTVSTEFSPSGMRATIVELGTTDEQRTISGRTPAPNPIAFEQALTHGHAGTGTNVTAAGPATLDEAITLMRVEVARAPGGVIDGFGLPPPGTFTGPVARLRDAWRFFMGCCCMPCWESVCLPCWNGCGGPCWAVCVLPCFMHFELLCCGYDAVGIAAAEEEERERLLHVSPFPLPSESGGHEAAHTDLPILLPPGHHEPISPVGEEEIAFRDRLLAVDVPTAGGPPQTILR